MPRLRRIDCSSAGITRSLRADDEGRGFESFDPGGALVTDPEALQRIVGLAIPPVWHGLATMRKEHVVLDRPVLCFDYIAKGGKRRVQSVVDPEVAEVVSGLKRRRGGGPELRRSSYIDPRVFDRFLSGWTISGVLECLGAEFGGPSTQGPVEEAVIDLLEDDRASPAVERVTALA